MPSKLLGDAGEHALKLVEESQAYHDTFVANADKRWREFKGRLERNTDAAKWMSQAHPPYLNHIAETQLSGLLDEQISFRIRPYPRLFNPGEAASLRQGAEAHEMLFRCQLKKDHFNDFQRPYALDAAVTGVGFAKTFWQSEHKKRKRRVVENAAPEWMAQFGIHIPRLKTVEAVEAVFDGPVTEALDPRDVYWHEAATSVEKSRFVAHAIWITHADLMELAKRGVYDEDACRELKNATEEGGDSLDTDRGKRGRRKDMIEVLEVWDREKQRVTTIGARRALLRNRDWPFWHGRYPFVSTALQPIPRQIKSVSMVEKLGHLQEMTWDLMNQRIDNLRFINNFITIMRNDVEDPDAFPYEPGAVWFSEDPESVVQWAPTPIPAEVSLAAESLLKQDMQNLAGGQPFTSTSEARGIGADTATEAALVTNLAQMATKQMKARLYGAYSEIGQQRLELNQQFITLPAAAEKIGLDGEEEIVEIAPHLLAGDYLFDISPMNESLNRAERRSEAQGRFQTFMQAAPVLAAVGVNVNYQRLVDDLLDAWDVQDKDGYYSAAPPPAAPAPGQQQAAPPTDGGGGVTAPQSIDPATSPSTQASLSPAVFQQRAATFSGGANNV